MAVSRFLLRKRKIRKARAERRRKVLRQIARSRRSRPIGRGFFRKGRGRRRWGRLRGEKEKRGRPRKRLSREILLLRDRDRRETRRHRSRQREKGHWDRPGIGRRLSHRAVRERDMGRTMWPRNSLQESFLFARRAGRR